MQGEPTDNIVAAAVEAIDERTPSQTDFVMAALVRSAWPGGIGDRAEPGALQWVRSWGPGQVKSDSHDGCGCIEGRCLVCN